MIVETGSQGQVVISELQGAVLVTEQYFFMDREEAVSTFREEFPEEVEPTGDEG